MSEKPRILVVEDNEEVAKAYRDLLGENFNLFLVASFQDALSELNGGVKFDAAILDRMDGNAYQRFILALINVFGFERKNIKVISASVDGTRMKGIEYFSKFELTKDKRFAYFLDMFLNQPAQV